MPNNVILVGFMGTGKSSIGRILAQKLGRPLVDMDRLIEEREGRRVAEIFEKLGEPHFRAVEKELVRELTSRDGQVITTGGGVVIDAENRRLLRQAGVVVSLSASAETVQERVEHSAHRPLLKIGGDPVEHIRTLMKSREEFYGDADLFFNTDGKKPAEVAPLILEALKAKGIR